MTLSLCPVISCCFPSERPKNLALKRHLLDASCQSHFHLWRLPFASKVLFNCKPCLYFLASQQERLGISCDFTFSLVKVICFHNNVFCSLKNSLHLSWSPIEASKELEVAKSVEMSEEAVGKSIFVESLEHCVVPTSDVDHALVGEDLDLEGSKMMNKNCDVDIEGSKKWHDGGKRMNEVRDEAEKAAVHSTKKGSLDKLTPQDGPIKITSVKLCHRRWFEKKIDFRGFWC